MNSQQDHELAAKKVAALLDQGAREIDSATAAKLLEIRKEALAHFTDKPAHSWVPEWATTVGGWLGGRPGSGLNMRMSVVFLALLASLACVIAWQTFGQQGNEIADIDTALLTDELPPNAFLDKGFDAWVRRP